MKRNPADLLEEAMELPPEARAAVAGSRSDSADDQRDEGAEVAWGAAIARRIRERDDGRLELVPWAEARRRLTGH